MNANLPKEKGVAKLGISTHSRCHVSFSFYEHGKKIQSFPLWHCRNVIISIVGHYKAMEICYWRFMFKIKAS
jgi:hypothetical protein